MIILYIIIFIFFIYFIFDISTRKYINPYKMTMIIGKKGSGKTTYLTKLALDYIKKGHPVYSNVKLPGTYTINPNLIGKYTFPVGAVVLIDEVGMIWDNRDFKSFPKEVRDYFKYQRQYKNIVYLFSQTFDIDLKLRNLCDSMYLLSNKFRIFTIGRKISKSLTITQGTESSASTLADQYQFESIFSYKSLIITCIPRYKAFYNSYDPKVLPIINGIYNEMTKDQLLSFKFYFIYLLNDIQNRLKNEFITMRKNKK